MSRIGRKNCLSSTSYLAGLFGIFILLHVWQNCVCFGDFFYHWGHFVMLIIRKLNLISVQSWTYLNKYEIRVSSWIILLMVKLLIVSLICHPYLKRIKLLVRIWRKIKLSFRSFYILIYCLKARVSIVRKTMVRNHRRAASSPSAKFKYLRKR